MDPLPPPEHRSGGGLERRDRPLALRRPDELERARARPRPARGRLVGLTPHRHRPAAAAHRARLAASSTTASRTRSRRASTASASRSRTSTSRARVLHRAPELGPRPAGPVRARGRRAATRSSRAGSSTTRQPGELRLYYGAADTSICLATAQLDDLLAAVLRSPRSGEGPPARGGPAPGCVLTRRSRAGPGARRCFRRARRWSRSWKMPAASRPRIETSTVALRIAFTVIAVVCVMVSIEAAHRESRVWPRPGFGKEVPKKLSQDDVRRSGCDRRVRGKDAGSLDSQGYRGDRGRSIVPPSAAGDTTGHSVKLLSSCNGRTDPARLETAHLRAVCGRSPRSRSRARLAPLARGARRALPLAPADADSRRSAPFEHAPLLRLRPRATRARRRSSRPSGSRARSRRRATSRTRSRASRACASRSSTSTSSTSTGSTATAAASTSASPTQRAATRPTAPAATCSTPSRAPTSASATAGSCSTSTSPTTRRARTTRAGCARSRRPGTGSPVPVRAGERYPA